MIPRFAQQPGTFKKVPSLSESTGEPFTVLVSPRFMMLLPPIAEQTAIATILSDMDAEISALETKLAKYKQIKQGMMQELLTGKIRLM